MMWIFAAFVPAAHAVPDRVPKTFEVGTALEDVAVSADGNVVAMVDSGSGGVFILDTETWELVAVDVCTGASGITAWPNDDARFFVGCSGGELAWFEVNSGEVSMGDAIVGIADEDILKVTSNTNFVYAAAKHPDGGNPQVHAYNPEDGTVLTSGFPSTLGYSSVEDMEATVNYVLVSHGGATMSKVAAGTGGASIQQGAPGAARTGDIVIVGSSRVLVAGEGSGVLDFQTGSNILSLLLTDAGGVESATALAANEDDEWFAICDEEQDSILIHDLDTFSGAPTSEQLEVIALPSTGGAIREFALSNGYLYGATEAGFLHVITERPWVNVYRASPSTALADEEVQIAFDSDVDGTWTARLGADSNTNGTVLASGTVQAGEAEQALFTVNDAFKEGTNRVRIVVEDGDGLKGHDSATVEIDNPPSQVTLRNRDVGFGDGLIRVQINAIDDEDLSHYMVYVSSVSYTASEYSSEGPAFVGVEGDSSAASLDLPRRVNANPDTDRTITIKPLTNGATYHVAVRAYDEAGQEGPMSNVVSESPRETFGAAELAGDRGGYQCGSVVAPAAGFLALLGGLFAGVRRRALPLAVGLTVFSTNPAHAANDSEWPQKGTEWSDFIGAAFEARYGTMTLSDEDITGVFGDDGHSMVSFEWGPTFFELIELTGTAGYFKATGKLVDSEGNKSAQDDTIFAVPFMVDVSLRLDVLPEQVLVPFAGIGYDYWLWQESWDGGGSVSGGKSGMHTTYGAHLLLDIFQPARASRLEAQTGITDTFITVEYRTQTIGKGQGGLEFSGDVLTFGLKLDH